VTFWLLANICSNPTIFHSFATEIDDAILASESVTALSMNLQKRAPLNAVYNENLRIVNNSSADRLVAEKCSINGKTYEPGARILLVYRNLAMSQDVFGMDSNIFRPERFLLDKKLDRSRSFTPFGGGKHMCPGRFIIKRASMAFAALVVHRFQVDAMDTLPDMNLSKLPLGPVEPVKGTDMRLSISHHRDVKYGEK
jgi:cytochrome P450